MKSRATKYLTSFGIILVLLLFVISFVRGNFIVKRSEKEFNSTLQKGEAQTKGYSLQEIDAKTGLLRWELTAKEGETKEKSNVAVITDIQAKVYKDKEVIFELNAPYGKANAHKNEVYLSGGVTTKNKTGDFTLKSNQLGLGIGNGTSIEAKKGFDLTLKDKGDLSGESALINEDQSKISVSNLKNASFKDLLFSGKKVSIQRDKNGDIENAMITKGGEIVIKNKDSNDTLTASIINWIKNGTVEAIKNVVYISKDITFKASYLALNPEGKITANGHVQIKHGETNCSGNSLTYDNNSTVVIKGNSKAIQEGKEINADKIQYDVNTGKVEATGNVRTIINGKA